MEIKTRELNGRRGPKEKRYIAVEVSDGGTTIDCGLLDYKERIELAKHLKDIVEELMYGINNEIE